MNKKVLIIGVIAALVITSVMLVSIMTMWSSTPKVVINQSTNEKIGLVINSPNPSLSLQQIDEIFTNAATTGIGRSNVYLFWNLLEPQRGEFDWNYSDLILGLNEKNNFKVTLFFSVVNGKTLGPFPDWIGNPSLGSIGEERLVNVLDAILSRYNIIDTVIISGEIESQFRYNEQSIPVYTELFSNVYNTIKEKHPDVKFGNSFALHHILNKELSHIVSQLSSVGDFVAFSYFPIDILNDIVKTPQEAKNDLQQVFDLVPDKKIGFFEVGWSTSDFVNGDINSQRVFLKNLFELYSENESSIEFLTWYRQYDKSDDTCLINQQVIGDANIDIDSSSGFGGNEYVIERLNHYVCKSGLVSANGNEKQGWNELKTQIEMLR